MRMIVTALAGALLALAPGASAQLGPGISGSSSAPREGVPDDYWILLRNMGECAARAKHDKAVAFLAAPPGSAAEGRAFQRLFGGNGNMCMRDFVSATLLRAHVRGAVAEWLYKKHASRASAAAVTGEATGQITSLHDFARCYVAGNERAARRLLDETRLGSDSEQDMVVAMAPSFAGCFPADRQIEIEAFEVRMALAEALYRRVAPAGEG